MAARGGELLTQPDPRRYSRSAAHGFDRGKSQLPGYSCWA